MTDRVSHPPHYNTGKIEVIDFIEDQKLGFCLGNTVKYIARSKHKGSEIEDLEKARWYLDRQIAALKARLSPVPPLDDEALSKRNAMRMIDLVAPLIPGIVMSAALADLDPIRNRKTYKNRNQPSKRGKK